MSEEQYNAPIVTLCGSTRFKDKFMSVAEELSLRGAIVLMPNVFTHTDAPGVKLIPEKLEMLERNHRQKILMSHAIFVINVHGYIGRATREEIEFAKAHDKTVYYLEDL